MENKAPPNAKKRRQTAARKTAAKENGSEKRQRGTFLNIQDPPSWLILWGFVMTILLVYEVFVFPFVHTFVFDKEPDDLGFAGRVLPSVFTGIFVLDVILLSWRTQDKRGIEDARPSELIKL